MVTNHILNLRFSSGEVSQDSQGCAMAGSGSNGRNVGPPEPRHQEPGDFARPRHNVMGWEITSKQKSFFFSTGHQYFIYYRNRNRNICIYIYILIIIDDLPVMMRFHEVPAFFCSEWPASTCPRQDTCLVVTAVIAARKRNVRKWPCAKSGVGKKVCIVAQLLIGFDRDGLFHELVTWLLQAL